MIRGCNCGRPALNGRCIGRGVQRRRRRRRAASPGARFAGSCWPLCEAAISTKLSTPIHTALTAILRDRTPPGAPTMAEEQAEEPSSRLCIKNVPKYVTEKRLKEHFAARGAVTDVKILKTKCVRARPACRGAAGRARRLRGGPPLLCAPPPWRRRHRGCRRLAAARARAAQQLACAPPWSPHAGVGPPARANRPARAARRRAAPGTGSRGRWHLSGTAPPRRPRTRCATLTAPLWTPAAWRSRCGVGCPPLSRRG
jgi:hypothetical protein